MDDAGNEYKEEMLNGTSVRINQYGVLENPEYPE